MWNLLRLFAYIFIETMKNAYQIIFTLSLLVAVAFNASADGNGPKKEKRHFISDMTQLINYEQYAKETGRQGVVYVKYDIDQYNKIKVTEIQSTDAQLKEYVLSKLNGQEITSATDETKDLVLKFNFVYNVEDDVAPSLLKKL